MQRIFKLNSVVLAVSLLHSGKQSHVHASGAECVEGTAPDGTPQCFTGDPMDVQIKDDVIVGKARELMELIGAYLADASSVPVRGAKHNALISPE
ncbi:MAG: hypothetical protein KF822_12465 [Steroidobacteraceae bacterium]|nr:hypothetical protein [Steroidobacteraceae bacterium]